MANDPIRPIHLGKGVWLNQRHQSGAPDMKPMLAEQVRFMRDHLASADTTPQTWVDGGSDFELVADKLDEMQRESLAHAWGYLKGAADMAALTVEELLNKYGLSLSAKKTPRPFVTWSCPKCGSKGHRCKTGGPGCRHCNNEACGHGWQQK